MPRSQLFKKRRFIRFIVSDPARVRTLVRRSGFASFVTLSHEFIAIICMFYWLVMRTSEEYSDIRGVKFTTICTR